MKTKRPGQQGQIGNLLFEICSDVPDMESVTKDSNQPSARQKMAIFLAGKKWQTICYGLI